MRNYTAETFPTVMGALTLAMAQAERVEVGEWQGRRGGPQAVTWEIEDLSLECNIPQSDEDWRDQVRPNLPWAEAHFKERISGLPLNPPPSHEDWPFASKSNEAHVDDRGRFSHTYPERFWPRFAHYSQAQLRRYDPLWQPVVGVRFQYGDLGDLLHLLRTRPGTRQAYLPVWFPEDLYAANHLSERVPCTLGYHFLIRKGRLNIKYYIRSCDFYRHFRDDVYMAGRLCQWVAEELGDLKPGKLVMHISSLHVFEGEEVQLKAQADAQLSTNLASML